MSHPTGYGAAQHGRFGYGAIPPEGIEAVSIITLNSRAFHVVKPTQQTARPTREAVTIRNLSNTIVTLQAVPEARRQRLTATPPPPIKLGPRRKARIFLADYDEGQIAELRRRGVIFLERATPNG